MCEEFLLVDRVVSLLDVGQPLLEIAPSLFMLFARRAKGAVECSLKRRINAIEIAPNVLDGNDAVRFFTNGRGDALLKPVHQSQTGTADCGHNQRDRQKGQQNPLSNTERHRSPRLADQSKLPNADRLAIAPGAQQSAASGRLRSPCHLAVVFSFLAGVA